MSAGKAYPVEMELSKTNGTGHNSTTAVVGFAVAGYEVQPNIMVNLQTTPNSADCLSVQLHLAHKLYASATGKAVSSQVQLVAFPNANAV